VTTNTGNFDNPLILAIETSGRLGSVALAQGDKLLSETRFSGQMRHSAEIFPAVTDLLSRFNKKPDQIEHVYISVGPGSFTGLRIAVTFAKTMALANSAKIVAVDTLDCIAANVINFTAEHAENTEKKNNLCGLCDLSGEISRLAVILDAKRGQFFIAVYEKTQDVIWKKILPDCLMTTEAFLAQFSDKPIAITGEGLVFYKDKFTHKNVSVLDEKLWNPSAANVHKLGWQLALQKQFADPLTLIPNYIRGPDVTVKQI
jgi:tRNA threonylcarbamoyl adenosine modification protein YeaZ